MTDEQLMSLRSPEGTTELHTPNIVPPEETVGQEVGVITVEEETDGLVISDINSATDISSTIADSKYY